MTINKQARRFGPPVVISVWSWQVLGVDAGGWIICRAPFTQDEGTPESVYYSLGR